VWCCYCSLRFLFFLFLSFSFVLLFGKAAFAAACAVGLRNPFFFLRFSLRKRHLAASLISSFLASSFVCLLTAFFFVFSCVLGGVRVLSWELVFFLYCFFWGKGERDGGEGSASVIVCRVR
jgi:hypothetical protein